MVYFLSLKRILPILFIITLLHKTNGLYLSKEFPVKESESIEYLHAVFRTQDKWTSWSGLVLPYGFDLNLTSHGCLIFQDHGRSEMFSARQCINEGASAVIMLIGFGNYPGFTSWTFGKEKLRVPVVEVSLPGGIDMFNRLENEEMMFVSMKYEDDVNKWYDAFKHPAMIWYSVSLGILTLVNMILSGWRLFNYIRKYGFVLSLAQTILSMILFSNTLKFIVVTIDPIYSRAIFGYLASTILQTFTFPISSLTTLLITFYWHEIITLNSSRVYINIRKRIFVIPLIIFAVGIFLLEIGSSITRGLQYNVMKLGNASTGLFIGLLVIINVYCIVIGTKVIRKLERSSGAIKKNMRRNKLVNVTKGIMLGSVSTMLAIPFLAIIFSETFRQPVVFIIVFYFIYFFLSIGDTFKILAFGFPSTKISSTKKERTSSSKEISNQKTDD